MSESCGYIPVDQIFPALKRTAAGGRWLLADFFTHYKDGTVLTNSGHLLQDFLAQCTKAGLKREYEEDITDQVIPTLKFVYSFNQSLSINQNTQSLQSNLEFVERSPGYQYPFQNILDNANTFTHNNLFHNFSVTHTLNPSTFYEVKFNYFFTNLRADANGLFYDQYTEPKDFVNFPIEYFNEDSDTVGVIPGDGFWDVGNQFTYRDHFLREFSIKGDITSFFDEKNKFKAGFNLRFQEMQMLDIFRPWVGELGLNNDIYQVYPAMGSFYAQDNINFGGMILNFGLRLDYWFPGKFVDDAVRNPDVITIPDQVREDYFNDTFAWFGDRRYKARLSPRIGVSHPVSDNQTLFFSYGHFSRWPNPQFVYAKLDPHNAQSSFQRFGNPNLNPETTVAYELGLKTQFTPDDVLTITAYYKDIFDYVSTRSAIITSARLIGRRFITYVNTDYARSRGLEIEFIKRIGKWFNVNAGFSYAIVTGKSSSADEGVLILRGDLVEPIKEQPLSWDRPLTATLSANFYVEQGSFGMGEGILDDWSLYFRAFYQSGRRYTPVVFTGAIDEQGRKEYEIVRDKRNSEIGDDWFYIDLNFEKYFRIASNTFSFFIEVNNLLDTKNSTILNPVTGRAYEFGDDVPSSWNDPRFPDVQAPISPFPFNPTPLSLLLFSSYSPLVGQSDHLANISVGIEDTEKTQQLSVLFNYASERVTQRAGAQPDFVEDPGLTIDIVARTEVKLGVPLELSFEARNITGRDNFEFQQLGSNRVEFNTYQVGTSFSFGIKADF
ncbi:MAG: TonB-dependent receptor [Candidatus Marinimicrobia bacterium]|nr:TonB-dependent receptor [Candidatus Neomarinimicrobiota bacterium]